MSPSRLLAVMFIFACTCAAWLILGSSVVHRTGKADRRLAREVEQLWGGRHEQLPPEVWIERPTRTVETVQEKKDDGTTSTREVVRMVTKTSPLPLDSTRIDVAFELDPRRKGLLWYATRRGSS